MDAAKSLARKGNPLRADIGWPVILIEGLIAAAIGLWALTNEEGAQRNLYALIGAFLLIDGLGAAMEHYRRRGADDAMAEFRLLRAGVSIIVGSIVVFDRFVDFLDLNPVKVILGLGLIAIGLISLVGMFLTRRDTMLRFGAMIGAVLLAAWGILLLYQANQDTSSTRTVAWAMIVIGGGLIGLAIFRRQRMQPRHDIRPAAS